MDYRKLYEGGPIAIFPKVYKDDRGYFYETFNEKEFKTIKFHEDKNNILK